MFLSSTWLYFICVSGFPVVVIWRNNRCGHDPTAFSPQLHQQQRLFNGHTRSVQEVRKPCFIFGYPHSPSPSLPSFLSSFLNSLLPPSFPPFFLASFLPPPPPPPPLFLPSFLPSFLSESVALRSSLPAHTHVQYVCLLMLCHCLFQMVLVNCTENDTSSASTTALLLHWQRCVARHVR